MFVGGMKAGEAQTFKDIKLIICGVSLKETIPRNVIRDGSGR